MRFHQLCLVVIKAIRYQIGLNVQIEGAQNGLISLHNFYSGNICQSGNSDLQQILFEQRINRFWQNSPTVFFEWFVQAGFAITRRSAANTH
jgi:hypothetical protein